MAGQQMIGAFASSSNSSSMVSSKNYDVFLSFRGEDTRKNFTSHLHEALKQKKVETYIDYRLKRGDEISPALIRAIEDSHVSVVILSENYASSKWCLEELNKILECKENKGQIVIPVFYNIDPSIVRYQTGSFEKAFAKYEGHPNSNKWKASLTEVANLAGWDSRDRIESELVKDIVGDVLQKLTPTYPNQLKELVGIEDNYKQIESLLKIGSSEVRALGIWGMGGIGKTTLATALYSKLFHKFEGGCFLANIRERSNKDGLEALRNKIFSKLLENDQNHCFDGPFSIPHFVMRRLGHKKVFIVLDDVDTSEQLEYLTEGFDLLGRGSRVIVTTRDKQIFNQVDEVYTVKELCYQHSLQLFCLTVFGEEQPKHGYEDLSRSAIFYCKGTPLALKVLGASLRRRSKEAWESELRKLQQSQNMKIHNILKLSYDDLEPFEKDIFLDIACFFKGETRDSVTKLLDASNFYATSGIEVLLDKALITISDYNRIEMHDLIQQMGQEIVRQESIKDPGIRTRLWKPEEVHEVLKNNRGTHVVEGIILDLDTLIGDLCLSFDSLAKMTNMRFLKIYRRGSNDGFNVYFPNGVESLSYKLRYLRWNGCCLESLSSNFCAEQLVELHMPFSKVKKLWDGVQNLVNLKVIDLPGSRYLIEIPDLSKAEKLKSVILYECESLRQLHPSMSSLPELTYLCLDFDTLNGDLCLRPNSLAKMTNVRLLKIYRGKLHVWRNEGLNVYFPNDLESLSYKLRYLHWDGCYFESMLSNFCAERLVELNMPHSKLTKLWDGIQNVVNLKTIDLWASKDLIEIPDLSKAEKLEFVYLNGCESLRELHPSMLSLQNLRQLFINGCRGIESLNVHSKSLKNLWAIKCSSLQEFLIGSITAPDHYERMQHNASELSLEELFLSQTNVESLPANIKNLSSLRHLSLHRCSKLVSLPDLPQSLTWLHLNGCSKLVSLSDLPLSLIELDLDGCCKLVSLPELPTLLKEVSAQNCTSLDTDSTQRLVLQHMLQSLIPNRNSEYYYRHFIFPGDHVTDEHGFRTARSSITIPYLSLPPSCLLHAFIYCAILPKGFCHDISHSVMCSIYQDGKQVGWDSNKSISKNLISEHVLFSYVKIEFHVHSDDLPFILEFYCQDKHHQVSIKEFRVFPVYASESGLKLFEFDSSSKEIFESESITDIFDDESHPRGIGAGSSTNGNENDRGIGVGSSTNENENEWEQLLNPLSVFF